MDTLASLFSLDPQRLRQELIEQVLAGDAWLASCGRDVTAEVAGAMAQCLPDALEPRLDQLIVNAFRSAPPPLVAEGSAEGPEAELPLPPQRLESRHRPSLELQVDGGPILTACFVVSLELELRDFALRLRNGQPVAVRTGTTTGAGILQLEGRLLSRFHGRSLWLPELLPLRAPAGW